MRKSHRLCDEEMLSLPDCVCLTEKGGCTKLNISVCVGSNCSFFNSNHKKNFTPDRWKERLANLPENEQLRIAHKYYSGAMPWK